MGKIMHVCYLGRNILPKHELWRLVRYLNAAHVLGYCGLSQTYNETNTFYPINENEKLLTKWEVDRIQEIGLDNGSKCFNEVICWAIDVLDQSGPACESDKQPLKNEVLSLADLVGGLYSFDEQPFPLIYLHTLFLMTAIYMPLMSYTLAVNFVVKATNSILEEIFGAMLLTMFLLFTVGLIALGKFFMNPYGDDSNDLSVLDYVHSTIMASRRVISGQVMPASNVELEMALEKDRSSKGNGFIDGDIDMCEHVGYYVRNDF